MGGSVVQLVRIHACHAWGRGFESRPNRWKKHLCGKAVGAFLFVLCLPLFPRIEFRFDEWLYFLSKTFGRL